MRLFKTFNFATANVMMFIFGVLLFSSLVMMPQFLQTVLGYTAGLVVLLEMPIVGRLAGKYPAKYVIASGWLALALGMYVSTLQRDTLISFQSVDVLRVMQSVGLGLLSVPVTMAGYIGMRPEKANSVAGIINFMRNIGSSVGTSMVATPLPRRAQVSSEPGQSNEPATGALRLERCRRAQAGLRSALSIGGKASADPRLHRRVIVLTIAASIMFLLSFIVHKNDPKAGSGVAVG